METTLLFTVVTYEYIVSCGHGFIAPLPPILQAAPLWEERRFLESYEDRKMLQVSVNCLYVHFMSAYVKEINTQVAK